MAKMRYTNKKDVEDSGEVCDWIIKNIPNLATVPISVEMNNGDKTVRDIRFGKSLTVKEEEILLKKYSELTEDEDRQKI